MVKGTDGLESFMPFLFSQEVDGDLHNVGKAAEKTVSHILAHFGLITESRRGAEEETARLWGATKGDRCCIAWHVMSLVYCIAVSLPLPEDFFRRPNGTNAVFIISTAEGVYMHVQVRAYTYIYTTGSSGLGFIMLCVWGQLLSVRSLHRCCPHRSLFCPGPGRVRSSQ
jgi:hypothetical protein